MNDLLTAALHYAQFNGFAVFPVVPRAKTPLTANGFKDASKDAATINQWWAAHPTANIGIPTGAVNGFDVLDIDDLALLDELPALPDTPYQITGSGGYHYLFTHHQDVTNKRGELPEGIDVRGDGGYIVVEPSIHPSGTQYLWELSSHPDDTPLASWPDEWLELVLVDTDKPAAVLPDILPAGQRNELLTSLAGSMRHRGATEAGILAALKEENKRCVEPLPDKEIALIARSVGKMDMGTVHVISQRFRDADGDWKEATEEQPPGKERAFAFTDMGNGERLAFRYGQDIRYCQELANRAVEDGWLIWNGMYWSIDRQQTIAAFAKETVRAIEKYEAGKTFKDEKDLGLAWFHQSQSRSRLEAMIKLAQSEPDITINTSALDRHPYRLGVRNGTLDLKTGQLSPPNRQDYITQTSGVEYNPNARCPAWLGFLSDVFEGNDHLVEFVQRMTGYMLTGDTSEQKCFFFYGEGSNGKSTLIDTLAALLGNYSQTAPATTFMEQKYEGVSNDLAMLRPARLVSATETNENQQLNEALIKRLTGGDPVTARFLHREFFTYTPQFKVILATNHKPRIQGGDLGIWRRIRLLPFNVRFGERGFPPAKRGMKSQLFKELPGILNWALDGCMAWQRHGLSAPAEVMEATNAYRDEQDVLKPFLDECCEDGKRVEQKVLYAAYQVFEPDFKSQLSAKDFSKKLRQKGYEIQSSNGKKYWKGIDLNSFGFRLGNGFSVGSWDEQDSD